MTTEIEKTKRQMYADLKRFESMVGSTHLFKNFQDSLEDHLEALRLDRVQFTEARRDDVAVRLATMTEERDQIQQRLHAVDHAYSEQSKLTAAQTKEIERLNELNRIAGQELIRVQGVARQHLDDCVSAERHSDRFSEQLRDAQAVIANQEQLIVGQRLAVADLYIAGRRVNSAVATLQRLGYTDNGGQLWRPPLGRVPSFATCANPDHHALCKCGHG